MSDPEGLTPAIRGGTPCNSTPNRSSSSTRKAGCSCPIVLARRGRRAADRGRGASMRSDRPGDLAREIRRAPHGLRRAHLQRGVRPLGRHPRLIEPVEQVFGEKVYMHQYKINAKAKFDGDVWQWHQDYGTWTRDDGMPEPSAMNISVFLDEVFAVNGPLMLIPGSHKHGNSRPATTRPPPASAVDARPRHRREAGRRGGIVAPVGKPGSMLMFPGTWCTARPATSGRFRARSCTSRNRGLQPHPQADAPRVDRTPGLPPDRALRR